MLVVDTLFKYLGTYGHFNRQSLGYVAVTKVGHQELILLKPSVAMNLNGRSISKVVTMYKVNPSDVILVHDDLDRPVGKYSLKHGGSAGGHNRVTSAIASLHSDSLRRVRVGVGRPSKRDNVTEYVLSNFDPLEMLVMERTIEQCCEVLMKELQLLRS
ncbi:uncharacterized protein LOC113668177 [Pocillopora damicornis]|nr:uncharacterized protein LOC113668177 [Pocillopora damicornis]